MSNCKSIVLNNMIIDMRSVPKSDSRMENSEYANRDHETASPFASRGHHRVM